MKNANLGEINSNVPEWLTGRPGESKSDLVRKLAERDGFEVIEVCVAMDPKERAAWDALAIIDYVDPDTPEYAALTEKLRWLPSGLPQVDA